MLRNRMPSVNPWTLSKWSITNWSLAALVAITLGVGGRTHGASPEPNARKPIIQIALLLDTSNSMDGLIRQAKSELWRMVNELIVAKQNGVSPELHVSLYEYGNNRLEASVGHIRQVLPLTTDLDQASEQLFALTTNGGNEYCGQVIQAAVRELTWSESPDDLKIIVIAGNEPFTQGSVDYHVACREAIAKGIIVNTIHCGDGVPDDWRNGAVLADGRAMNIDQNQTVVQIAAPQDQEIVRLSEELNTTYVAYGAKGREGMLRQTVQDANASNVSQENATQRAICKANGFYQNAMWDLVDAVKEKKVDLAKLKDEELPETLRKMTLPERTAHIAAQQKMRDDLRSKINQLNKERETYVAEQRKLAVSSGQETLDQAFIKTIREQAVARKYEFAK